MKAGATLVWKALSAAWLAAWRVPGKYKYLFLLKPLDATRYLEFGYLLEFLDQNVSPTGAALDVSSPVLIAHILARKGYRVTKTDISAEEEKFVGCGRNPHFEIQDARCLSYPDRSFNLVVSISVIEHIYDGYVPAINEMVRVTQPGGYVYLTFPVARKHLEEWLDSDVYGAQSRDGNKVFFQYRFGPDEYRALKEELPANAELVAADIFWERKEGLYDKLVNRLRKKSRFVMANHLKASFWNLVSGPCFFKKDPADFENSRSFGNVQWILKIRETG